MLGFEGHGILTIQLTMDYDEGGCQGFGGYDLRGSENLMRWITGLLKTVDVEEWENLKGSYIRVKLDSDGVEGRIKEIGHLLKDKWFDPIKNAT